MQHSSEFHKRLFESAVGSIRTIAANHLWQVLMFFIKKCSLSILIAEGDHLLLFFLLKASGGTCGSEWSFEGIERLFSFSKR